MKTSSEYDFDWADLAFGSKKPLKDLGAIFIAAPRELTTERFKQLIKDRLPNNNIVLGLSKDDYVSGFELQPQFKTLKVDSVQKLIDQVNGSSSTKKIYTISYFQREEKHLIEKLNFKQILFINGSWKYALQNRDVFYQAIKQEIPSERVSAFSNDTEAKEFEKKYDTEIKAQFPIEQGEYTSIEMLGLAMTSSIYSYDYNFQTGAVLGKLVGEGSDKYKLLEYSYNKVTPYQTYAMTYGASREENYSPPHDLNFYDTVHAEVMMMLKAGVNKIDLKGTSLFINLMPCPTCARMFCESDIEEFIYQFDHSEGYAVKMLILAGKKVRRLVLEDKPKI